MKISYLLCFICFSVCLNVIGQTEGIADNYEIKKDSLKQLIDEFSGNERNLVRLKNEYARLCFINHEFENGFVSLQDAKTISEKINYKEGEVMYYLSLSSFHADPNNAINLYYRKKAQSLSNNLEEDIDDTSNFTNITTDSNIDLQQINEEFRAIISKGSISENKELQANVLYVIAQTYYGLRNGEKVIEYLTKAISVFSELDEIYLVFHLSSIKMEVLIYLEKTEEAKEIELQLIQAMAAEQDKNNLALIHSAMANSYRLQGRWSLAIEYYLKTLDLLDPVEDMQLRLIDQYNLGVSYENYGMNRRAADNYRTVISELEKIQDTPDLYRVYGTIVFPLIAIDEYDDAKKYMQLSLQDTLRNKDWTLARYNDAQGQILKSQGKYEEAIFYFQKAETGFSKMEGVAWANAFMKFYIAECNFELKNYDKALQFATESLKMDSNEQATEKATLLLSQIYEQLDDPTLAYQYLKDYQLLRSEKEESEESNRIADAEIRSILDESEKEIDRLEREKLEKEKESLFQRGLIISVLIVLIFVGLFALFLYRNNKNKQRANALLKRQKKKIEVTLNKLKATQSQLIQSEKMASLGELTAGIAHEIQNPLNFVNNFSDVNKELLTEMKDEMSKGNFNEAKEIVDDVIGNEEKINHHGKRADSIVKGMLEHSRTSSSEKVLTDVNTLVDEYVRLSYHGLRAKDKAFQSDYVLELDPNLPKVEVVPQDIGRVLLNIINNAFYAVNDKRKMVMDNYKPTIKINTTVLNSSKEKGFYDSDKIKIIIQDNGNGIPKDQINKIFQPFFTTKPTGQGTGLGLSLSYDIVKAHGGELLVDTEDGKGTTFTVILPIKDKK